MKITDPKKVEAFIDAMDEAYEKRLAEGVKKKDTRYLVTDPEEIRAAMTKRVPKTGEVIVVDSIRKQIACRLIALEKSNY